MKQHAPFFTILIILFFLTGCGLFGSLEVEPTATPTTIATPTSERGPAVTPEALPTEIPSSTPTSPPELPEDTPATPTPTPTNSAEEDDEVEHEEVEEAGEEGRDPGRLGAAGAGNDESVQDTQGGSLTSSAPATPSSLWVGPPIAPSTKS